MKQKSKKLILLFILSLVMILGLGTIVNAADTYKSITIGINQGMNVNDDVAVSLVLGEHESETLKIKAVDSENNDVTNPNVTYTSSDESIATVDSNGTLTAKKVGNATITVTGGGISKTRDVKVTDSPKFVDFSNAKYTWKDSYYGTELKISDAPYMDLINADTRTSSFTYIIKTDNAKLNLEKSENGYVNPKYKEEIENNGGMVGSLYEESISLMAKYVELNTDIYLWILQDNKFETYYNENGKSVYSDTRIVVDGIKLDRFEYPTYSGLFSSTFVSNDTTQININAPCATQRSFTVKIGKINDNSILNKIKNNESDGFANLEAYAKSNSAIYEEKVKSSHTNLIDLQDVALPLKEKLENKEYYYLYIIMDDENGKYAPIEHCITLAEGWKLNDNWSLHFYGDDKFNWKDFSTEGTGEKYIPGETGTKATTNEQNNGSNKVLTLPYTGTMSIGLIIVTMVGSAVFFKIKNNKYKGI